MYKLILTKEERDAIDWIGNRYWHGYELYNLLTDLECELDHEYDDQYSPWELDCDVTFKIPEHVAWEMKEKADEADWQFDCFSDELTKKLTDFLLQIV